MLVNETGWLIEGEQEYKPVWLGQMFGQLEWTVDSYAAIRFARKKDAVDLIRVLPPQVVQSSSVPLTGTEHEWSPTNA